MVVDSNGFICAIPRSQKLNWFELTVYNIFLNYPRPLPFKRDQELAETKKSRNDQLLHTQPLSPTPTMTTIEAGEDDALHTERKSLARVIRELEFEMDDEFGGQEQPARKRLGSFSQASSSSHAHADEFPKTSSLSSSTKRSSTSTTATTILWLTLLLTIVSYVFVSEFRFVTNFLNPPLRPP